MMTPNFVDRKFTGEKFRNRGALIGKETEFVCHDILLLLHYISISDTSAVLFHFGVLRLPLDS